MMATVPVAPAAPGSKKLSFAKVAASGTKENMPNMASPRVAVPAVDPRRAPSSPTTTAKNGTTTLVKSISPIEVTKSSRETSNSMGISGDTSSDQERSGQTSIAKLVQGTKDLSMSLAAPKATLATSTPSLVVNGSSPSLDEPRIKTENGTASSDNVSNVSQKADSSSEIGTKAPSLDGKSITSGTTFAMDEKESLRPDDSASVKAAVDDDEAFSVRGSQMANSRMGSQIARVHSLRIGDMPERQFVQMVPGITERGTATPQSSSSEQPPTAENAQAAAVAVSGPADALSSMYSQNPDEKLLEAMSSPKDRLFLLRLEQEVINFVQSSKEPFMDLPPNNSFCRMLTHKLADYYHMTHSFEGAKGTVRIFRTPFCRVPPSLASIVSENKSSSAPPVTLPKKIMRRGEDGGSGQASGSPSKATSEVGSDGKEKSGLIKEKSKTREQREEEYIKARERIFGESTTPDDDTNGMSRASSVSAREKSNLGKRGKTGKQRRDDSESFDSRSQYTLYYTAPQQPTWTSQFVPTAAAQFNGQVQQPYQHAMPPTYPQPAPNYSQMMAPGPMSGYPQYGTMSTYSPQPSQQRYPPSSMGPAPGYASTMQPPPPQQGWQQGGYNNQSPSPVPAPFHQGPRGPQNQAQGNGAQGPMGVVPYAFGQLPVHANPNDPKSQHPIPGSFPGTQNRHAFNPKTQTFVPGGGMSPVQPQLAPYNMSASHGSPQVGSPHLAYNGFNSPAHPQTYMGAPPSFGMSRQGSNNSLPAYHTHATPQQHLPPHLPQHPSPHMPQQMPPQMGNQMGNQMSNQMVNQMGNQLPPQQMNHQMQSNGMPGPSNRPPTQQFSSLPNYGNPATLPQKPPTGI